MISGLSVQSDEVDLEAVVPAGLRLEGLCLLEHGPHEPEDLFLASALEDLQYEVAVECKLLSGQQDYLLGQVLRARGVHSAVACRHRGGVRDYAVIWSFLDEAGPDLPAEGIACYLDDSGGDRIQPERVEVA